MAGVSCPGRNASDLLEQMEHILDSDPLIDEVGFVHPSQFRELSEDSDISLQSLVDDVQIADDNVDPGILRSGVMWYDSTVFWCRDHKLAISTKALQTLYDAAVLAFMDVAGKYMILMNLQENPTCSVNEFAGDNSLCLTAVENDLMRHSKALLILSCDFGTAWNSRKLLISRKQNSLLLMEELRLSSLILSYSPKSELAWSHRRWAIKAIAGKDWNLPELLQKESEIVEKIAEVYFSVEELDTINAEDQQTAFWAQFTDLNLLVMDMLISGTKKSRMNYRAWYHRSWLVSYMNKGQVVDELNQSRKWTELHVTDNCCFHYRRRLMLQLLGENFKQNLDSTFNFKSGLVSAWKVLQEELDWDELLIKRYIGREALWVHRRFLSYHLVNHFMVEQSALCQLSETHNLDSFINNELQLLRSCLSMSDNEFEDGIVHVQLAASYILWIYKLLDYGIREKYKELRELKTILNEVSPEKTSLWEDLMK